MGQLGVGAFAQKQGRLLERGWFLLLLLIEEEHGLSLGRYGSSAASADA